MNRHAITLTVLTLLSGVAISGCSSKSGGEPLDKSKGARQFQRLSRNPAGHRGGRSVPSGGWATEPGAGPGRERQPGETGSRIDEETGNRIGGDRSATPPAANGKPGGQAPGSDIDEGRRHGTKSMGQ
ncbi:hypothetical protein [Geomesophilobacter sediminis]|uniref:Lipoprotein n=1 Tax=Geomesophilobacter sediminis TaxID=2798584 RepID=A0A8J7M0Q0_9BACT|nr:hypothetical protein [Geomesophilobacter sediminis]MBJ6726342.1 hypothetical protein [Geomesophilobacter sediminis]